MFAVDVMNLLDCVQDFTRRNRADPSSSSVPSVKCLAQQCGGVDKLLKPLSQIKLFGSQIYCSVISDSSGSRMICMLPMICAQSILIFINVKGHAEHDP